MLVDGAWGGRRRGLGGGRTGLVEDGRTACLVVNGVVGGGGLPSGGEPASTRWQGGGGGGLGFPWQRGGGRRAGGSPGPRTVPTAHCAGPATPALYEQLWFVPVVPLAARTGQFIYRRHGSYVRVRADDAAAQEQGERAVACASQPDDGGQLSGRRAAQLEKGGGGARGTGGGAGAGRAARLGRCPSRRRRLEPWPWRPPAARRDSPSPPARPA